MANVRTIHVDWYSQRPPRFSGGPQLAYQGDHLSNMVVFDNAPELPNYYLLVEMKTDDAGQVVDLPAILLEGPYWVIPNYYTQICQQITYQVCCKTESGDFEHHSAKFKGTILPVIKHNGEPIDQSPMFDPYIDILDKRVNELIVAAGDIQIDSELKNDSTNPVQNKIVKAAIDDLTDDVDAVNGRLGDLSADVYADGIAVSIYDRATGYKMAADGTYVPASGYITYHYNVTAGTYLHIVAPKESDGVWCFKDGKERESNVVGTVNTKGGSTYVTVPSGATYLWIASETETMTVHIADSRIAAAENEIDEAKMDITAAGFVGGFATKDITKNVIVLVDDSVTHHGVVFTKHSNGAVNLEGTASGEAWLYLIQNFAAFPSGVEAGDKLSIQLASADTNVQLQVWQSTNGTSGGSPIANITSASGAVTVTLSESAVGMAVRVRVADGWTGNSVCLPVISVVPEEYTELTQISEKGIKNVRGEVSGDRPTRTKNGVTFTYDDLGNFTVSGTASGEAYSYANQNYSGFPNGLDAGKTFYAEFVCDDTNVLFELFFTRNNSGLSSMGTLHAGESGAFTIPADATGVSYRTKVASGWTGDAKGTYAVLTAKNANMLTASIDDINDGLEELANQLVTEYAYNGDVISIKPKLRYKKMATIALGYVQGGACYDKYLFQFHSQNQGQDRHHGCSVVDLSNGETMQFITLGADSLKHNNNASFGTLKYSDSDAFPLLYVSQENENARCCIVYRITGSAGAFELTVVQTIVFPSAEEWAVTYPNSCIGDDGYLYILAFKGLNTYEMLKYSTPLPTTQNVELNYADKISDIDFTCPLTSQGFMVYEGKLYFTVGSASASAMYVVDVQNGNVVSTVNFNSCGLNYEPEAVYLYNDSLHITFVNSDGVGDVYRFIF